MAKNSELSPPPDGNDPRAQAEYFMDMLNALGAQATDEAKRIRAMLVETITSYRNNPNKKEALAELAARMSGIEVGVAQVLQGNANKMRERLLKDLKRIGGSSAAGKAAKAAVEGFGTLADALGLLATSALENDKDLRSQANRLLAKAREQLEKLGRR